MRIRISFPTASVAFGLIFFGFGIGTSRPASAFLEDICLSKTGGLKSCLVPASACEHPENAEDRGCLIQAAQFATIPPGRSLIHADSTYFIAQALGYRADVAYWIAAYNEVADYAVYAPIDQCGGQAAAGNSGADYITADFNGFQRTNIGTDGPLYHYVLNFSPNGQGTDTHGAGGVQALYPLHYPAPGYPEVIDDVFQGTLYNLRQWAMRRDESPGLLCAAGFTTPNGDSNFSGAECLAGVPITGTVPLLESFAIGTPLNLMSGPKVLDNSDGAVEYDQLKSWLEDPSRTTGVLWEDPARPPVPVQVARIGLYLHSLQDAASHATYCGDDAPSPPGGSDPGTYMTLGPDGVRLVYGTYCATGPHLAGHVQETGTGDDPLPLRDYVALNATLDELIAFGNDIAKPNGWIVTPDLLPPDVTGGASAAGDTAADLKARLVGRIAEGEAWSNAEVYESGIVTQPLRLPDVQERLDTLNAALLDYSNALVAAHPTFAALALMPGNSGVAGDTSACFH